MFSIFKTYRTLPTYMIIMHIFGKTLGGFGIGLLFGVYIKSVDWMTWGWVAIVLSFLVQLPVLLKVVSKNAAAKAVKQVESQNV